MRPRSSTTDPSRSNRRFRRARGRNVTATVQELRARDPRVPTVLVAERDQISAYPWHEVADEFVYTGAHAAEEWVDLESVAVVAGVLATAATTYCGLA